MEQTEKDMQQLTAFWDQEFHRHEEEYAQIDTPDEETLKQMAPSEELFLAASSLGNRKKVLDYGCGSGWAGLTAAVSGCQDVTCADTSPSALRTAGRLAEAYGIQDRMQFQKIDPGWLKTVPAGTYDGFFCSNVLDVIPITASQEIIEQAARAVSDDAEVIIGLNYALSQEEAEKRNLKMENRCLYINGILRLVSFDDAGWTARFSPYFTVERLVHFAWPGEERKRRRLFYLKKCVPKDSAKEDL